MPRCFLSSFLVLLVGLASGCDSSVPPPDPDLEPVEDTTYTPEPLAGYISYRHHEDSGSGIQRFWRRIDLETGQFLSQIDLNAFVFEEESRVEYPIRVVESPDESRLAVVTDGCNVCGTGPLEGLYFSRVGDEESTVVHTPVTGVRIHQLEWSPDNRKLLYTTWQRAYVATITPNNELAGPPECVSCEIPNDLIYGAHWGETAETVVLALRRSGAPNAVLEVNVDVPQSFETLDEGDILAGSVEPGGRHTALARFEDGAYRLIVKNLKSGVERDGKIPLEPGHQPNLYALQWADSGRYVLIHYAQDQPFINDDIVSLGVIDIKDPQLRWRPMLEHLTQASLKRFTVPRLTVHQPDA